MMNIKAFLFHGYQDKIILQSYVMTSSGIPLYTAVKKLTDHSKLSFN